MGLMLKNYLTGDSDHCKYLSIPQHLYAFPEQVRLFLMDQDIKAMENILVLTEPPNSY